MIINPELAKTLEQLKPIHLPSDSLWWPPAPGRVIASVIIAIFVYLIITNIIKKTLAYYQNRPLKTIQQALAELNAIETQLNQLNTLNNIQPIIIIIQKTARLLKKAAQTKYKSQNISSLTGKQWLEFLNTTGKTEQFTSPDGEMIVSIAYKNPASLSSEYLILKDKTKNLLNITKQRIKVNL